MNILAHLCLSGGIHYKMLGNYIGDFVKGRQYLNYLPEIQEGILLHRKIDYVADKHILHKQTRDLFRADFGLYAGIVTDIVFDHVLANQWDNYFQISLEQYATEVYQFLDNNNKYLPPAMQKITPYMIHNNWLVLYRSVAGLERVLNGMSQRTSLPAKATKAIAITIKEKEMLTNVFPELWSDLQNQIKSI
jgi:acyl carrier protein phosphodiesterase